MVPTSLRRRSLRSLCRRLYNIGPSALPDLCGMSISCVECVECVTSRLLFCRNVQWLDRPSRTMPAVGRRHIRACANTNMVYARHCIIPTGCRPSATMSSHYAPLMAGYLCIIPNGICAPCGRAAVMRPWVRHGASSYHVGATHLRRRSLRSLCRRVAGATTNTLHSPKSDIPLGIILLG